jgi:hypothetical protein
MNSLFISFLQQLEHEAKQKHSDHLAQNYRKVNHLSLSLPLLLLLFILKEKNILKSYSCDDNPNGRTERLI